MKHPLQTAHILALLVPAALLAGAYGFQYIGNLPPCEMCWWQRYPLMAAVAVALIAAIVANRTARLWLVRLAALAIAISGVIAVYHAGIEYKLWQGITACTATPITGTTAEILADVMATPLVRCDAIPWSLFGISLAGWNALISIFFAGMILWLTRKHR